MGGKNLKIGLHINVLPVEEVGLGFGTTGDIPPS